MTTSQWPTHLLDLDEWRALPEDDRRCERAVKLAEYAMAGIPRYAIVDLGAPVTLDLDAWSR